MRIIYVPGSKRKRRVAWSGKQAVSGDVSPNSLASISPTDPTVRKWDSKDLRTTCLIMKTSESTVAIVDLEMLCFLEAWHLLPFLNLFLMCQQWTLVIYTQHTHEKQRQVSNADSAQVILVKVNRHDLDSYISMGRFWMEVSWIHTTQEWWDTYYTRVSTLFQWLVHFMFVCLLYFKCSYPAFHQY